MSVEPFVPITKKRACELLQVSLRTLDYFIEQGAMPAPAHIGRHCYWHPEVFFGWLASRLGAPDADTSPVPRSQTDPAPAPRTRRHSGEQKAPVTVRRSAHPLATSKKTGSADPLSKQRARVAALNTV